MHIALYQAGDAKYTHKFIVPREETKYKTVETVRIIKDLNTNRVILIFKLVVIWSKKKLVVIYILFLKFNLVFILENLREKLLSQSTKNCMFDVFVTVNK